MAEASISVDQEQFSCVICLDLLKNPVTIPCGHSYCMGCIKSYWDQNDGTGVCCCPHCREAFSQRPVLNKNTLLAEVVETLKKTRLQAAPPAQCYAEPGDMVCDFCTGRKNKAIKSCLACLASYCETHLQPHYESPAFQKHKLVEATGNLQEKICSFHDKLLEIYCRTDQQCICYLCVMGEHRGHDTVSAAAEWTEKQKQLDMTQIKLQQRIQDREKELQDLRQAVQSLKRSAQAAMKINGKIFTELIRSIERRRSEVKELIRDQEKAEVSRAEGLLERLEQEIAELRRRDAELEQLSLTESFPSVSLCIPPGPGDLSSITVSPHVSFEAVRKSVSELKERLECICKAEVAKVFRKAAGRKGPPGQPPNPPDIRCWGCNQVGHLMRNCRDIPWTEPSPTNPWRGPPPNDPWRGPPPNNPWRGPPPNNPWRGPAPTNQWRGPAPTNPWRGQAPAKPRMGPAPANPWRGQAPTNPQR